MKASYDDYDKGERLELEDNEPESEPEEYGGIDYGDKELDQADDQAEIEEVDEEDVDEGEEGEEDGDMVEEEIEDEGEEIDGEGEEENDEGDHDTADEEEEEHHELVKERRKRKEFEIFVGGLDKDATEDDLKRGNMGYAIMLLKVRRGPKLFRGQKHVAIELYEEGKIALAIGVLRDAVINMSGRSPSNESWHAVFSEEKSALRVILKRYEDENGFIYLEKIPDAYELPSLEGKRIVEAIPYFPKRLGRELMFKI